MYEKLHDNRHFLRNVNQTGVKGDFKKPIVEIRESSRNYSYKGSVVACRTFYLDFLEIFTQLNAILAALGTQVLALGVFLPPEALLRRLGA